MSAYRLISVTFENHECPSAEWAGLKGFKNDELVRAAELAGYEVLLTVDQGMRHQQNIARRRISVIAIHAKTNQLEDLLPLLQAIQDALRTAKPGQTQTIG